METPSADWDATRLLHALHDGDRSALDAALPRLYDELRALAVAQLRGRPAATLQPAALVHEAYVKLAPGGGGGTVGRAHFLAIAAGAMRHVAVEHARAARLRGGGATVMLTDHAVALELKSDELLALDEALNQLDAQQRLIVECRFFAGMEERDIADALGMSDMTVRREWVKARAWLYSRLYPESAG